MKVKIEIKQIIPAPNNLYVLYKTDCSHGNEQIYSEVICLALQVDGEVVPMYISHNNIIERAEVDGEHMKVVQAEEIPENSRKLHSNEEVEYEL